MPRHPSFLLKIKITILDIFYISLSPSFSPSLFLSLPLSLSDQSRGCVHPYKHKARPHTPSSPVRERDKERERGREREHKARPHFKHSSFSQSVSMRDCYIKIPKRSLLTLCMLPNVVRTNGFRPSVVAPKMTNARGLQNEMSFPPARLINFLRL